MTAPAFLVIDMGRNKNIITIFISVRESYTIYNNMTVSVGESLTQNTVCYNFNSDINTSKWITCNNGLGLFGSKIIVTNPLESVV
jgi:hypothetical protein